jgi:hypothetical protein
LLKRLLVLGVGVGLLIATAYVVVSSESRDPEDITVGDGLLAMAVVSKRDIPANRDLDPLIERGVLVEI